MNKTQITAETGVPLIIVTRAFDAPRDLVFRAHTDPDLLVRWLGPRDLTLTVERYDLRDGGRWRYVHTDAQGNRYGSTGSSTATRHRTHRADVRVRRRAGSGQARHDHTGAARRPMTQASAWRNCSTRCRPAEPDGKRRPMAASADHGLTYLKDVSS